MLNCWCKFFTSLLAHQPLCDNKLCTTMLWMSHSWGVVPAGTDRSQILVQLYSYTSLSISVIQLHNKQFTQTELSRAVEGFVLCWSIFNYLSVYTGQEINTSPDNTPCLHGNKKNIDNERNPFYPECRPHYNATHHVSLLSWQQFLLVWKVEEKNPQTSEIQNQALMINDKTSTS